MGVVDRDAFSKTIQLIMKTALILGTVAVAFVFAEPEAEPKADADPYLLYGGYTASTTRHMQHMPPTATPTPMAMEATSTAGRRGKPILSPRLTLIHGCIMAATLASTTLATTPTQPTPPTQPIPAAMWPTAGRRGR